MLGSQISNMVLMLGLSQFLRRFDLTTPDAIMYMRIMYVTSQVLQLLFWLYIRRVVSQGPKQETTTIIEVTEPAKPFSTEPPKKTKMSIREYDLAEVSKHLRQMAQQILIMCVMHLWLKFTQPLVMQSLMPWKTILMLPIVQIRLYGFKAEGNLARPWKIPNPFADFMPTEEDETGEDKKHDGEIEDKKVVDGAAAAAGIGASPKKAADGVKARKAPVAVSEDN